ncbi:hypothetical protein [Paracoccus sanguinis]|uniref:hypothetical protein n=1 Tax=Paracoccus sanguinis TaxID=1545044 RepID=UPI001E2C35BB|nr:hypothetical protein [Paracoccus sanguinis]
MTHDWQPGIGDPTWQGWATVLVYLVAAALALVASGSGSGSGAGAARERWFWRLTGVLLLLLAVNKQLDLQSALTAYGRCLAMAQGWYENRRWVQLGFLAALALLALWLLVGMLRLLSGTLARTGLAAVGVAVVAGFVMIRAVGFHHVDGLLRLPVMGLRANTVLEWTGPVLIAIGALGVLLRPRRR